MKKFALFLLVVFALAACDKKDDDGRLDMNAKIKVSGVASGTKAYTAPGAGIGGSNIADSVGFIARYAWGWGGRYSEDLGFLQKKGDPTGSGLGNWNDDYPTYHDTIGNRLFFHGSLVIEQSGALGMVVTSTNDIIYYCMIDPETGKAVHPLDFSKISAGGRNPLTFPKDTIGYIPNAVAETAKVAIIAAYNKGDYTACYKFFDEAYLFKPTTGAKWREMKAQGIE